MSGIIIVEDKSFCYIIDGNEFVYKRRNKWIIIIIQFYIMFGVHFRKVYEFHVIQDYFLQSSR